MNTQTHPPTIAGEFGALEAQPQPPPPDREMFARICKALGHPARVRIVEYLLAADRCICGEIVGTLPLAQSTVSQHLKRLRESGLVKGEVEGPRTCYCIDHAVLDGFLRAAAALRRPGPRRTEDAA